MISASCVVVTNAFALFPLGGQTTCILLLLTIASSARAMLYLLNVKLLSKLCLTALLLCKYLCYHYIYQIYHFPEGMIRWTRQNLNRGRNSLRLASSASSRNSRSPSALARTM